METFIAAKEMVEDPSFEEKREKALKQFHMSEIDPQIRDVVNGFAQMEHCFTVQSCHGHIIEQDTDSKVIRRIDPEPELPETGCYQLAYLALVIENSVPGRELMRALAGLASEDEEFIQWGCAEWFWITQGHPNSYVIQVQPYRFRNLDRFTMEREEAETWLAARDRLFRKVRKILGLP